MRDPVRVLHVDDDPDFADLTATFLEREDDRFTVETATGAKEGLERIEIDDIDCIVSDYDMPGTDGIEFLETVSETYPDLPFILFTGKGSEEIASDAVSAGVTDYLQKKSASEQYELLANRIRNAVERYETERERRQWKMAIETANEGIAIVDEGGQFLQMNDAFAGAYGETPSALVGTNWREWYPDEEIDRFEETVLPTLGREGIWEGESVGCRTDGTEFEQRLSLSTLPTGGHVCVMEDITERRLRELELERQNERLEELVEKHEAAETRYRTLFENSPVVVWEEDLSGVKERLDELAAEVDDLGTHLENDRETLLSLAEAIEIRDVNEYAVNHYNAPSKDVLMENLDELVTERSYEMFKDEFVALAAGETEITLETQARTFDGDLKDELIHVFVPDEYEDDYSCVYATATDITERKRRERELEETTTKLQALVRAFPDVAFIKDVDGNYLEAFAGPESESLLYGGPEAYDGDQNVRDVFDDPDPVLETIRRAVETSQIQTLEYQLQVPSGLRWFEGRVAPLAERIYDTPAVVWVARDITERKED